MDILQLITLYMKLRIVKIEIFYFIFFISVLIYHILEISIQRGC